MENFITEVDILNESKESFLTYSAEVLTDRAIPAAEDGLLSAQRKILWTMEDYLKMNNKGKTKKCNAIVGSTLATSYFHGDASCYGVLCKMSQDYLMRYPLIQGQGSLGTQENNDMVASSRYTEAKPSKFADVMMEDFKKNVVPLKETYNGEFMEPVVLPSLFPNAICNGRQAIGISMSHNSLPHNLSEVCDGIIAYIKNNNLTVDELMTYIKGPDFPLENVIINSKDIRAAFATGHSATSLKVRGVYNIKGQVITFTTIPYRTYRNKIKEQLEKNVDIFDELLDDFNDESSLGKNKLVFTVKKNVNPESVVNKLFALTDLQTTLSYNMNYIVNGTPRMCSMLNLIDAYVKHQTNVLLAATEFDKDKAEKRAHILEGLLIVIKDIDKAIKLIKESLNTTEAKEKLIKEFNLDEAQAKAVLDMKLGKLTKLDKDDLLKELEEKKAIIAECNRIINEETYRNNKLIAKIVDLKNKYGDARRTELLNIEVPKEEKEIEEVVPEDCVVILSQTGEIKRVPSTSFKVQKRKGKGIKTENEVILDTIATNTIDTLMLFTNKGKMFRLLVDNLPIGTNISKGVPVGTLINLDNDEKVIAITSLHRKTNAEFVLFITKQGLIKKTKIDEYTKVKRSTGIAAIKLKEGDSLANVTFVKDENLILITKQGMAIQVETKDITTIGRVTSGVKGIKLLEKDEVIVGIPIHNIKDCIAVFSSKGLAKKSSLAEFPLQNRGGRGVMLHKGTDDIGDIVGAAALSDEDNILLCGKPNSICISSADIPFLTRTSAGNIMVQNSIINHIVKL